MGWGRGERGERAKEEGGRAEVPSGQGFQRLNGGTAEARVNSIEL